MDIAKHVLFNEMMASGRRERIQQNDKAQRQNDTAQLQNDEILREDAASNQRCNALISMLQGGNFR